VTIKVFTLHISVTNNTARYNQHKTTTRSTFPRKIGGTRSAPPKEKRKRRRKKKQTNKKKNGRIHDTNLFG
jgi:hypothetical protein